MFATVLDNSDFALITLIVGLICSTISLKPWERARLSRLEAKVDLLLKHTGLAYDPMAAVPSGVLDALQGGNKIEAIKLYREATGVGLAEAKDRVEELQTSLKA